MIYVVIPHPDDEFSVWSLVQQAKDQGAFLVFLLLTQGEATTHCSPPGGDICKEQRVASWHEFLDTEFSVDTSGRVDDFDLSIGRDSARLVFDLGDGETTEAHASATPLSATSVSAAINRALRVPLVSDPGVRRLVTGCYYNRNHDGSLLNTHRDHAAVHAAVRGHSTPAIRAVRTPTTAPRQDAVLTVRDYHGLMNCPDGAFNLAYGWLATDGCWPTGEDDRASSIRGGFVRQQAFECFSLA